MHDRLSRRAEVSGILFEPERRILASLSEADIRRVRALRSENLTKERHRILGVRSEDLFYFLQCVQQGFIPVAVHELRGKSGDSHLYLAPNPESRYLREQEPDAFNPGSSFKRMVEMNVGTYGDIAKAQALYRSVVARIPDREAFNRDVCRYTYRHYASLYYESPEQMGIEMAGEDYYNDLLASFSESRPAYKDDELDEAQAILYRALPELATTLKPSFEAVLRSLPRRSGILVGFSEEIARRYVEDRKAEDADDLAYHIPDGRLPLEHVVGFEPLGEYEDDALAGLGIE